MPCVEVKHPPHITIVDGIGGGEDDVIGLERRSSSFRENLLCNVSSSMESETTAQLRAQVIEQQKDLEAITKQMKILLEQVATTQQQGANATIGQQQQPVMMLPHDRSSSELDCISTATLESRGTTTLFPMQRITEEETRLEEKTIVKQQLTGLLSDDKRDKCHEEDNNMAEDVKEVIMMTREKQEFQTEIVATAPNRHMSETGNTCAPLEIKEAKVKRDIAMRRAKERDEQHQKNGMLQCASPLTMPQSDHHVASGKAESESTQHSFIKFRAVQGGAAAAAVPPPDSQVCAGCWNHWEGQEQSSSGRARLYRCGKCNVVVHSGCRSFFHRVFPSSCPFNGNEPDWMEDVVNCSGHLQVMVQQVIQLDDVDPDKDKIFAVLSLLPGNDVIRTPPASWGEMGAAWPALPYEEVLEASDDDHREKGGGVEDVISLPLSLSYVPNGDGAGTPPLPVLHIEVLRKRKYGGIAAMTLGSGEEVMGCAEVGISPLMAHPHILERRWLQLKPSLPSVNTPPPLTSALSAAESSSFHSIFSSPPLALVTMTYVPEHVTHTPVQYSNMLLVSPSNSTGPITAFSPTRDVGLSSGEVQVIERSDRGGSVEYARTVVTSSLAVSTSSSDIGEHPKAAFEDDPPVEPPAESSGETYNDSSLVVTTREVSETTATSVHNEEEQQQHADTPQHRSNLQHLFRLKSYLGPTWCAYCKSVLFGFSNQGFQCEVCGVNVHRGCQVKANLLADCKGIFAAHRNGAETKSDNETTRLGEAVYGGGFGLIQQQQSESDGSTNVSSLKSEGVGLVQVHVQSVHLCTSTCSEWGHDLTNHHGSHTSSTAGVQRNGLIGDYYCRMGFCNAITQTQRTQTVFQSTAPVFNESFVLSAPSYDALLELELVDSASDKVVGKWSATCFDLLQLDYDSLFSREPLPGDISRRLNLVSDTNVAVHVTSVVRGFLLARVSFQEDTEAFFWGANPRRAPDRESSKAKSDLSIELFSTAVSRVSRIIKWLKGWIEVVEFMFSWESPALSGLAAITILYCSLLASTEYILALPVFFVLLHMTLTLGARYSGHFVRTLSTASIGEPILPNSGDDGLFQPVAMLKVAIIRGRNILSSEMGLPGNSFVRLWYCPMDVDDVAETTTEGEERNTTSAATTATATVEPSSPYSNLIEKGGGANEYDSVVHSRKGERGGYTEEDTEDGTSDQEGGGVERDVISPKMVGRKRRIHSCSYYGNNNSFGCPADPPPGWIIGETTPYWLASSDPEWASTGELGTGRGRALAQTQYIRKGDVFLQNVPYFWHSNSPGVGDDGHLSFSFPVLQPISSGGHLVPWSQYHGFLKFEAFLANPFNSAMDTYIGETRIPLSCLISKEGDLSGGEQPEVRGWYPLSTSTEYIPGPPGEDHLTNEWTSSDDTPAIYLRMQITLRDETEPPTPDEKEASRAVFQLLNSSHYTSDKSQRSGRSKNPLTALFKLRDSISAVLRVVINILGMAEALKNLLNWSHPYKSAAVYGMIVMAWTLLLIVPSRVFLFTGGMAAFYAGLRNKLKRDKDKKRSGRPTSSRNPNNQSQPVNVAEDRKISPLAIKLANLFATIPTDIELERAYLWRTQQGGSMSLKSNYSALRLGSALQDNRNKMRILGLGIQWQGAVFFHGKRSWERKFLVLQGHRLAWWTTAAAIEEGKPADGQLLLQGHSGLTDPSPVEMRLTDNPSLLICAFGRGSSGYPARVGLLLSYTYKAVTIFFPLL